MNSYNKLKEPWAIPTESRELYSQKGPIMNIFWLNLQLFGEGGADAPADAGAASGDAAPSLATKNEKNPTPHVIYGKAQVTQTDSSKNQQEQTAVEETFDDLIKGKYKDDFQKQIDIILKKRLRNSAEMESQNASMRELLENTARSYGIDPESETLIEDVRKAQEADEEIFAKEAFKRNMSVDAYKRELAKDKEIKTLSKKVADNEKRERDQMWVKGLRDQVPEVQKIFPNFNLDEEMKNPNFAYLVRPGSPTSLEDAMYCVHHREILTGAVKTAAQQAAQKTANAVAANIARPQEGGLSSASPTIVKSDPSKWTKEDRAEIRRRVAKGERIEL